MKRATPRMLGQALRRSIEDQLDRLARRHLERCALGRALSGDVPAGNRARTVAVRRARRARTARTRTIGNRPQRTRHLIGARRGDHALRTGRGSLPGLSIAGGRHRHLDVDRPAPDEVVMAAGLNLDDLRNPAERGATGSAVLQSLAAEATVSERQDLAFSLRILQSDRLEGSAAGLHSDEASLAPRVREPHSEFGLGVLVGELDAVLAVDRGRSAAYRAEARSQERSPPASQQLSHTRKSSPKWSS